MEPCPACNCDLSGSEVTITPVPQSDLVVLRRTWPIVAGCVLVWGAGILYLLWRVFL
jgi:hypothetical protein